MVTVADLHYNIILWQPTITVNNEGGRDKAWTVSYPTKAAIKRLNQVRVLEAGADSLVDGERVVIRFTKERKNITKEWKVQYNGKMADIVEIGFTGLYNREWIELIVKEKTSGATL